jgi:hypothetical protein
MSAQTPLTDFDAVVVTIRSQKSFFEVTEAIEASLHRLSVPRLMEYVEHGDRKVTPANPHAPVLLHGGFTRQTHPQVLTISPRAQLNRVLT